LCAKLETRNSKLLFYNFPVPSDSENARRARVAESIGLAVIALIILIITLARYGRAVNWSLR
jgi:hypothetical protein